MSASPLSIVSSRYSGIMDELKDLLANRKTEEQKKNNLTQIKCQSENFDIELWFDLTFELCHLFQELF
jgi:hypothetical protein